MGVLRDLVRVTARHTWRCRTGAVTVLWFELNTGSSAGSVTIRVVASAGCGHDAYTDIATVRPGVAVPLAGRPLEDADAGGRRRGVLM